MMVVIADAIFEASGRSGRLNASDDPFGDQYAEGVVHGLKRDGADLGPGRLRHLVGRNVRLSRYRPQDGQSLRGDLNSGLAEDVYRIEGQTSTTISQILE